MNEEQKQQLFRDLIIGLMKNASLNLMIQGSSEVQIFFIDNKRPIILNADGTWKF